VRLHRRSATARPVVQRSMTCSCGSFVVGDASGRQRPAQRCRGSVGRNCPPAYSLQGIGSRVGSMTNTGCRSGSPDGGAEVRQGAAARRRRSLVDHSDQATAVRRATVTLVADGLRAMGELRVLVFWREWSLILSFPPQFGQCSGVQLEHALEWPGRTDACALAEPPNSSRWRPTTCGRTCSQRVPGSRTPSLSVSCSSSNSSFGHVTVKPPATPIASNGASRISRSYTRQRADLRRQHVVAAMHALHLQQQLVRGGAARWRLELEHHPTSGVVLHPIVARWRAGDGAHSCFGRLRSPGLWLWGRVTWARACAATPDLSPRPSAI